MGRRGIVGMMGLAMTLLSGSGGLAAPPAIELVAIWSGIDGLEEAAALNISGLACTAEVAGRKVCLTVYDEKRHARFVTLRDRGFELGPEITLLDKVLRDPATGAKVENKEADLEAVARDGDLVYVFGSHSAKKSQDGKGGICPPQPGRRHLYRFAVAPTTGLPAFALEKGKVSPSIARVDHLIEVLAGLPEVGPRLTDNACIDAGGLNIEGAAVVGGRMWLGLRAPVLPGPQGDTALVVTLDAAALFDHRDPGAKVWRVALGAGMGIRDMAPVAGGFLLLAGPSLPDDKPKDARDWRKPASTLWLWPGDARPAVPLATLDGVPDRGKPETVMVLSETTAAWRVLVMSDGIAGGGPLEYAVTKP